MHQTTPPRVPPSVCNVVGHVFVRPGSNVFVLGSGDCRFSNRKDVLISCRCKMPRGLVSGSSVRWQSRGAFWFGPRSNFLVLCSGGCRCFTRLNYIDIKFLNMPHGLLSGSDHPSRRAPVRWQCQRLSPCLGFPSSPLPCHQPTRVVLPSSRPTEVVICNAHRCLQHRCL